MQLGYLHFFQNEIISFMSNQVYSFIKQELHEAEFFTVLADETKDISKCEQLSNAFRYVHHGKTIERFVGYSLASDLSARSLANYITAKMTDLQLNPDHLVSQCYDGASVMSGFNAGVHKFIKEKSSQVVYVHCCAHQLNLVLVDVAKSIRAASDFFSHLQALYIFLSASKSHELFLLNQNALGGREIRLKKLSDTRWSCRIDSITAILATYSAVLKTLEDVSNGSDCDRAIEAVRILHGVKSFNFVVALVIFKKIFSVSANLSDVLQSESIHLAAASFLIQSTIDTFKGLRSDDHWGVLWEEINVFAKHQNIEIPSKDTRRQRRPPSTLNEYVVTADTIGSCDETVSSSLSDHYKTSVYFATLDVVIVEMNE